MNKIEITITSTEQYANIEPLTIDSDQIDLHNNYDCIETFFLRKTKKANMVFKKSGFGVKNYPNLPTQLNLKFLNSCIAVLDYTTKTDFDEMTLSQFQGLLMPDGSYNIYVAFMNGFGIEINCGSFYIEY